MSLSYPQQIQESIKKSRRILIVLKKDPSLDAVASGLALAHVLNNLNKPTDIVCDDYKKTKNLNFLPTTKIKSELNNLRQFIISLNTKESKVGEFNYDVEHDKLNIFITPKKGFFQQKDVITSNSNYKYDLIFTIDAPDLASLGKIYEEQTEFFYSTPIINIDHLADNEHFGQINLVNLSATSCAEIIFDLFTELYPKIFDEDVSTFLLTGLIAKTKNFKTPQVTPKTLDIAGHLISTGAKREEIVKNLYHSRFLSTLKLWGRVLARLRNDLDNKLVWSVLKYEDFLETASQEEDLIEVIDELIVNMPSVELVVLFHERKEGGILGIIYATKHHNVLNLVRSFHPEGGKDLAKFTLPDKSLVEAEREVIETIKQNLN